MSLPFGSMRMGASLRGGFNHKLFPFAAQLADNSGWFSRTFGAATSTDTFTIAFWLNLHSGIECNFMQAGGAGNDTDSHLTVSSNGQLQWTGHSSYYKRLLRKFRDYSGWTHVILRSNPTGQTIEINGEIATDLQNDTLRTANVFNSAILHIIGGQTRNGPTAKSDYSIADYHFIDGAEHTGADFGKVYKKNPNIFEAIIPNIPDYGNNGSHKDFADSEDLGKDVSDKGNHWTVNGTITQVQDSPSDNACTWNPLDQLTTNPRPTFTQGNTLATEASATASFAIAAFGSRDTFEVTWKIEAIGGGCRVGLWDANYITQNAPHFHKYVYYQENGGSGTVENPAAAYGASFTTGDTIRLKADPIAGIYEFFKNDVSQGVINSSDSGNIKLPTARLVSGTSVTIQDFRTSNLPKVTDQTPNLTGTTATLAINDFWFLGGPLDPIATNTIGATTLVEGTHYEKKSNGIVMLAAFGSGHAYDFDLLGVVGGKGQPPMNGQ